VWRRCVAGEAALPANVTDLEKRLWDAADELRANSKLKASEYGEPVLGPDHRRR